MDNFEFLKLKRKLPEVLECDLNKKDVYSSLHHIKIVDSIYNNDITITDIQTLICRIIGSNYYTAVPRWCNLKKPQNFSAVQLNVIEGISYDEYHDMVDEFKSENNYEFEKCHDKFIDRFDQSYRILDSISYGLDWKFELFQIMRGFLFQSVDLKSNLDVNICPVDNKKRKRSKLEDKLSSLEIKIKAKSLKYSKAHLEHGTNNFSRTYLLLNESCMRKHEIPLPGDPHTNEFIATNDNYQSVNDKSPIYAIDCEMVQTENLDTGVISSELVSITIVNEQREVVYDTYVKPVNKVLDYLTHISGVNENTLKDVTTSLQDVQKVLQRILPADAILAGHSIGFDLKAIQMFHPYIIDTSAIYRTKETKEKLRKLSYLFLDRVIQKRSKRGHNSKEDALATMDLILTKLSTYIEFGDITCEKYKCEVLGEPERRTNHIESYHNRAPDNLLIISTNLNNHMDRQKMLCDNFYRHLTVNLFDDFLDKLKTPVLIKHITENPNNYRNWFKLGKPWFNNNQHEFLHKITKEEDKKNKHYLNRNHPFNLNIIDFNNQYNFHSCSSKHKTMLLKKMLTKLVDEVDRMPDKSLVCVLFLSNKYDPNCLDGQWGQLFIGQNAVVNLKKKMNMPQ